MLNKTRYLYLALVPVLIGISSFVILLNAPYTGIEFAPSEGGWVIASIAPNSPASKEGLVGKQIISIAGWEIKKQELVKNFGDIKTLPELKHFWAAQQHFNDNIRIGSPFNITIQDGQNIKTIEITPVEYPVWKALSKIWAVFLIALASLAIGLILAIKKTEDTRVKVIFYTMVLTSWYMVCYASYTSREIVYNYPVFKIFEFMLDLIPLYIYALTLHFCLIFPKEKRITSNKYFFLLLYAIPLLIFWLYELRISYIALFIFIITYGLSSFFAIIHSYVTIKSPVEKTQVRWVIWGITICLLMLIFEFLPIILIGKTLFDQTFLLLSFIFFPLSIAFAITRYRLMDIDTLFDNTLIYATTLGVLAFLDIIIITALVNIQILSFRISEPIAMIIGVWVIIFTYIPIRNYIQDIIKRIFKREIYDINQVIIQFSRDLLTTSTIDSAFEKMLSRIDNTLHPKGSTAFLRKETGGYITFGSSANEIPLEIDIAKAEKIHAPTLLFNIITVESLPDSHNGGAFVPITGTQGYLGHCILQNKHSDRLYDKEDLKLLNIMANQLALTIEAILSRENAARKEKEAITEKERISREIHDGIGSRFVEAILLNDVVNKNVDNTQKIIKHSKELKHVLMEGLADLRELIWTVEPGQNTLGNLVSYIVDKTQYLKNKEDIKTNIITSIENENMPISSSLKLNIVRIIQEAITNTIKHASATRIDITIEQKNDHMKIKIIDNGKGFDISNSHPNGYGMRNIRKRCEDIGAQLDITSQINNGTKIAIELGLSQ